MASATQAKPASPGRGSAKREVKIVVGGGIELMPIDELKGHVRNARKHPAWQVEELAKQIRRNGFIDVVIIDETNTILSGHGRVMAAQKLEIGQVPCRRIENLTESQKLSYMIAANKLPLAATWDEVLLEANIKLINDEGDPLDGLGFDDAEITDLLAEHLVLPELGDHEPAMDTTPGSTEEGTAPPEESYQSEMYDGVASPLTALPDQDKPRYHQLPPEDRSRAIKASDERIPLAILLNREEYDRWIAYKKLIAKPLDKIAFLYVWDSFVQAEQMMAAEFHTEVLKSDTPAQTAAEGAKPKRKRKPKEDGDSEATVAAEQ